MRPEYLEQMQAHLDEGGGLSHQNGVDLLREVQQLRADAVRLKADLKALQDLIAMQPSIAFPANVTWPAKQ